MGPRAAPDAGHARPEVFGDAQTIVVDEAQFLAVAHVEALVALSNSGREVICFGLRTDFRGQLFPGAQRLFERADVIGQVGLEPRCATCDRTAVINARFVHGRLMRTGSVIVLGDSAGLQHNEATRYEPLCVRC